MKNRLGKLHNIRHSLQKDGGYVFLNQLEFEHF